MLFPIYCAVAIGIIVLAALKAPRMSKALWASEESAHETAVEKRSRAGEIRRESRFRSDRSAFASVLGDLNEPLPCRVVNASRSGLRIASGRDFTKGSQVCVQWGDEFFVGTVLYSSAEKDEHVAGLELTSGNHNWHPFARLCFWRRKASLRS